MHLSTNTVYNRLSCGIVFVDVFHEFNQSRELAGVAFQIIIVYIQSGSCSTVLAGIFKCFCCILFANVVTPVEMSVTGFVTPIQG